MCSCYSKIWAKIAGSLTEKLKRTIRTSSYYEFTVGRVATGCYSQLSTSFVAKFKQISVLQWAINTIKLRIDVPNPDRRIQRTCYEPVFLSRMPLAVGHHRSMTFCSSQISKVHITPHTVDYLLAFSAVDTRLIALSADEEVLSTWCPANGSNLLLNWWFNYSKWVHGFVHTIEVS